MGTYEQLGLIVKDGAALAGVELPF